jgi:hypothetical protein
MSTQAPYLFQLQDPVTGYVLLYVGAAPARLGSKLAGKSETLVGASAIVSAK